MNANLDAKPRKKVTQPIPRLRPRGETRLREWLTSQQLTVYSLAKQLGLTNKTVEYWANGQCIPMLVWAYKLEKFTNGAVPASSWLASDLGQRQWKTWGSEVTR